MRLGLALVAACVLTGRAAADAPSDPGRLHYERGARAFLRHDYGTAILEYQASYDLSGHPLLLYNLGQAYRHAGDLERALAAFERFLATAAAGRYRQLAADEVRALTQELAELPARVRARARAHARDDDDDDADADDTDADADATRRVRVRAAGRSSARARQPRGGGRAVVARRGPDLHRRGDRPRGPAEALVEHRPTVSRRSRRKRTT